MRRRCLRCSLGILLHWFAVSFPSKETSGPKRYKGQVLFSFSFNLSSSLCKSNFWVSYQSHFISESWLFFLPLVCFVLLQWLTVLLHIYQTLVLHSFHSKNLPLAAIKGEQHQHFHLAAGNQQWSVITTVFDLSPFQMHILWQFEHYFKSELFFMQKQAKQFKETEKDYKTWHYTCRSQRSVQKNVLVRSILQIFVRNGSTQVKYKWLGYNVLFIL